MISLETFVVLAGGAQLCLVAGSLMIPRVLRWREDVAQLRPLTRHVFWTYAAYIWSTNLFFGVVSVTMASDLVSGGPVSTALTAFIALYWGARLGIQFACFDRSDAPKGLFFDVAEWLLVGLFLGLTAVYGYATWISIGALV